MHHTAPPRARWRPTALRAAATALAAALLGLQPTPAAAGQLEDVQQRGTLRWCADQEGGGPLRLPPGR
jgi:hypothetical protein